MVQSIHVQIVVSSLDKTVNEWADFWYYTIGITPIPIFSKNKNDHTKPLSKVKWAKYQTIELDEKIFEEWKSQNLFKDGIAIIGGFVYRGKNKGKYLIMIDCDNQKGIDELSPKGGLKIMLERTLVEQHKDRADKAHIYFYSEKPVHKKSSSGNESSKGHPAIEVKGDGKHGIHIVSPSVHVDGSPYEITSIGITPAFVISLEEQIQKICDKFGIKYLDDESKFEYQQTQASKFMSVNFRIGESEGRRPALLSVCGHWFWERQERLNDEETYNEVLSLSDEWNKLHCTTPLTDSQIKKQCSDALKKAKYYVESGEMYPPIHNHTKKEKTNTKKPKIDFYELATELMYEYNFISHISKEIYYYSKGIYHKNGDKLIKKKCRQYWESVEIETHHIREIENIIRDTRMVLNYKDNSNQEIFDKDYKKIIVINGMYDFDEMKFKDYDPNVLATIKHPIYYDQSKQCPKFEKFLDSCFDGDEKRITQVLEMMALCFIKKYIIQKGYVNYGIGSNGKSTFLNILRNMLGLQNTSSIPMQQFQTSQFMGYELRGKCANISADGGIDPITKTGYIKSILGGDAIRCEQKRKDPFDFMPFVTLIFTFNELPVVSGFV